MRTHPELHSVAQLKMLLARHPSPANFVHAELNYDHPDRARILAEVIDFLLDVVGQAEPQHEADVLQRWAVATKPEEHQSLNIKGFKLAGFQYMRMLFGAQTTKPDTHIITSCLRPQAAESPTLRHLVFLRRPLRAKAYACARSIPPFGKCVPGCFSARRRIEIEM